MFLVETKTLTLEALLKEFIINLIISVFFFGFHAFVIMMAESDWNEFSLKKLILWIFLYAVVFQIILLILSNRIENALSERNYSLDEIKSFKDAANSDIFGVGFLEGTLLSLLTMVYVSSFHLPPFSCVHIRCIFYFPSVFNSSRMETWKLPLKSYSPLSRAC